MALIRLTQVSPHPPARAWTLVTAWERHADAVPFTRITLDTPPPTGAGTRFTARTGVGPLGFDDPMEVTRWQPPDTGRTGRCRLDKRGALVLGWAEIEVRPHGAGSVVDWREELSVRGLPRPADGALAPAGRWMFGRAVRRLLSAPAPPGPYGN